MNIANHDQYFFPTTAFATASTLVPVKVVSVESDLKILCSNKHPTQTHYTLKQRFLWLVKLRWTLPR